LPATIEPIFASSPSAFAPCYDPASHLVYAAGAQHVSHVWVDGKPRVRDRTLQGIDERELQLKALHWKERIKS
jgi:5-methylthioadenosine/S-adenosylhomocysteine deaminase